MTKKEILQSHLSLLDDGTIALTTDKPNGKTDILRRITNDEVINLLTIYYIAHMQKNPDAPALVLPLNDEQQMIVAVTPIPNDDVSPSVS